MVHGGHGGLDHWFCGYLPSGNHSSDTIEAAILPTYNQICEDYGEALQLDKARVSPYRT